jgi:serine/threonine-protein kinase
MRRFLQYIVEEAIAGRSNRLCEYSIGVSVFGRPECFEPALDPIVRNDARRLRQKLLVYYQRSEAVGSNELLIEVPKGGYVPVFRWSTPQCSKTIGNYRLIVQLLRSSDSPGPEFRWTSRWEHLK